MRIKRKKLLLTLLVWFSDWYVEAGILFLFLLVGSFVRQVQNELFYEGLLLCTVLLVIHLFGRWLGKKYHEIISFGRARITWRYCWLAIALISWLLFFGKYLHDKWSEIITSSGGEMASGLTWLGLLLVSFVYVSSRGIAEIKKTGKIENQRESNH